MLTPIDLLPAKILAPIAFTLALLGVAMLLALLLRALIDRLARAAGYRLPEKDHTHH